MTDTKNTIPNTGEEPKDGAEVKTTPPTEPKTGSNKTGKTEKKKKTIEVDEDILKAMQEQIKRLEAAADVSRLHKFDEAKAQEGQIIQTVRISYIDDKPVLATQLLRDTVFVDSRGVYHEDQIMRVFFPVDEDGAEVFQDIEYSAYHRAVNKKVAEILSQLKSSTGEIYNVRVKETGQELSIDSRFIN